MRAPTALHPWVSIFSQCLWSNGKLLSVEPKIAACFTGNTLCCFVRVLYGWRGHRCVLLYYVRHLSIGPCQKTVESRQLCFVSHCHIVDNEQWEQYIDTVNSSVSHDIWVLMLVVVGALRSWLRLLPLLDSRMRKPSHVSAGIRWKVPFPALTSC